MAALPVALAALVVEQEQMVQVMRLVVLEHQVKEMQAVEVPQQQLAAMVQAVVVAVLTQLD